MRLNNKTNFLGFSVPHPPLRRGEKFPQGKGKLLLVPYARLFTAPRTKPMKLKTKYFITQSLREARVVSAGRERQSGGGDRGQDRGLLLPGFVVVLCVSLGEFNLVKFFAR
jgi:hypothetical protein